VGIPIQPPNNGSESDNDSLPDLVDAPNMEVYVNNIIGNSDNSDNANASAIDVNNDVPPTPVINDDIETTEVDETVDDETMQVDDEVSLLQRRWNRRICQYLAISTCRATQIQMVDSRQLWQGYKWTRKTLMQVKLYVVYQGCHT
jgi:hypothetical protein